MGYGSSIIRCGIYYRELPDNIDFELIRLVYTERCIYVFFDLIFTVSVELVDVWYL